MDESNVIDERKAKLDAVEDECSYAYFDNEFFLGQDTLICYKDGSAIKSSKKNNDEDNSKDRKSTRLNSSHSQQSRMPSSA